MPYCPECGAQFGVGAKYCGECRAQLEKIDSSGRSSRAKAEPRAQQLEHVVWEGKPYLKEIATNTKYVLTTGRIIMQVDLGRRESR